MTGALAGLLAYWERFAHRPTVLLATTIAGAVVVAGMHYFEYRAYLDAPRSAQFEMMTSAFPDLAERHPGARPDGLFDFLRRMADAGRAMPFGWTAQGGWAWGSWAFDAALLIVAAVLVAWRFVRRPYCDVCRNYYRVLRQESLRPAAYRRLAASLGWSDEAVQSAAYHHTTCRGACGPELVRAVVSLESGGTVRREAWIDYADRARLFQQLDQSA
jgi:hypothetical protein